ncbi:hypothetical protein SAMN04487831_106130 [Pseudobutyrivibrio sp. UC1225]|uniref:PBECR4 domain-containing protein n=1 Tax=Pseudobutyrivibrio sp. UC1225 TaxID=1798185 RepID=UPI0008E4B14B|nr:PBECR4 domain-containing protein [Pseudobutyrivibrio sp. UC1225]SFO03660.1 hypothetical protein SAMN04487831_106130 [Pseudobutyrivibrio sp. UC1225]
MGETMNLLYDKLLDYKQIANYRVEYELDNGINLSVKLELSAFPHLIGLHKLTDMPIIRRFNDPNDKVVSAKYITQKIKQQKILTDSSVRASQKFCDIEERYNNFSKDNLLSLSYTEAIVNFNPSKIGSTLKSDFILFERKGAGYNHLCIATAVPSVYSDCYPESFFYRSNDMYIANQTIVKVRKVKIYDQNGKIYIEDTLIK